VVSKQRYESQLRKAVGSPPEQPDALVSEAYDELRQLARRYLRRERQDHTLQTTALVNEAYLRSVPGNDLRNVDRKRFVIMIAKAMREVLIDHARRHNALKRSGARQKVTLKHDIAVVDVSVIDLLAVDEALQRFSEVDPQAAQIVELRFFGGITEKQISTILGISTRTVEREWRIARLWLIHELQPGHHHVT